MKIKALFFLLVKVKSFINVSMYLVFTTNWGHKNKNYLQIRNNNNNVYTIKICTMYKLYNKKIGI